MEQAPGPTLRREAFAFPEAVASAVDAYAQAGPLVEPRSPGSAAVGTDGHVGGLGRYGIERRALLITGEFYDDELMALALDD